MRRVRVEAMYGDDPRMGRYLGVRPADIIVMDPEIRYHDEACRIVPQRIPERWHEAIRARLTERDREVRWPA